MDAEERRQEDLKAVQRLVAQFAAVALEKVTSKLSDTGECEVTISSTLTLKMNLSPKQIVIKDGPGGGVEVKEN